MTDRVSRSLTVTLDERELEVRISADGDQLKVSTGGDAQPAQVRPLGAHRWLVRLANRWVEVFGQIRAGEGKIVVGGRQYLVTIEDERARQFAALTRGAGGVSSKVLVRAPMPGLLVGIPVQVGQAVKRGERVAVLQAMKMENELTSPRDATVAAVHATEGQTVEQGFVLVTLEGE